MFCVKYTMCLYICLCLHEAERSIYECMYVCVCKSLMLERGLDWVGVLEGRILRGILLRHRMYDKERQSSLSLSRRSLAHSFARSFSLFLSLSFTDIYISFFISKIPQYVYSCILSLTPLASPALLSRFTRKFSCV